jgi:hypothetical protein
MMKQFVESIKNFKHEPMEMDRKNKLTWMELLDHCISAAVPYSRRR